MEITIYQPWGGLGDNLAHSNLPELCKSVGGKCFLSKHNAFRNKQIDDFVWGNNPWLETLRPDSTDLSWTDRVANVEKNEINHIEAIQKSYGFEQNLKYPSIYYKPEKDATYSERTLMDLSVYSIANEYNIDRLNEHIKRYLENKDIIIVTHSNVEYPAFYGGALNNYEHLNIIDLYTYSNILASCKKFITLHSGQAVLASSIKNKLKTEQVIDVLTVNRYLPANSCSYTFENTNYIPT